MRPRIRIAGGVLLAVALGIGTAAQALELPTASAVPGGVVILDLGRADTTPPRARYGKQQVMVVTKDGHWQAVVGIPLDAKPGIQRLTLRQRGKSLDSIAFRIDSKEYESQHITLKDQRMVEPTPEDLRRIRAEQQRIRAALGSWSESPPRTLQFERPTQGRFSSAFGLRRFFNGQPRRPHSGLDIAAPRGTAVRAPAPGRVVETGDYYFNGNTVFIDHGQGLVTMYCHLQRIAVRPGETVEAGDLIGAVGSTGRATGPHLHWSVSLNDTMVEPRLFLAGAAR